MMRLTSQLRSASLRAIALLATAGCVVAQDAPLTRAELAAKVADLEAANQSLAESLVAANGELRELTENHRRLRLEMEAFGIESVRNGSSGAGRRLMQAVNENLLLAEENKALRSSLVDLVDATLNLKTKAPGLDPASRKAADKALAGADSALGLGEKKSEEKKARVLSQGGKVVSVKQDIGIAVVDLGTKQGVNIGMPFELMRNGKPVGSAMVLDVREHISGVFIHKFATGTNRVAVGDLAYLQTQQRP